MTRDGSRLVAEVVDDLTAVARRVDHLGIDMPVGVPDGPDRVADKVARARLGPRRSSVFPTPPRALLDAVDHASANATSRRLHGRGLSVQAWNLVPKIRSVDLLVRTIPLPDRDRRVLEVHPECSFLQMSGTALPSKHDPAGRTVRADLIEHHVGRIPTLPRGSGRIDLLDACAVLWSTERFARGEHLELPAGDAAERDAHGTLMRIVV